MPTLKPAWNEKSKSQRLVNESRELNERSLCFRAGDRELQYLFVENRARRPLFPICFCPAQTRARKRGRRWAWIGTRRTKHPYFVSLGLSVTRYFVLRAQWHFNLSRAPFSSKPSASLDSIPLSPSSRKKRENDRSRIAFPVRYIVEKLPVWTNKYCERKGRRTRRDASKEETHTMLADRFTHVHAYCGKNWEATLFTEISTLNSWEIAWS